jgi:thiol-disulfide isomerase/thioredoxin
MNLEDIKTSIKNEFGVMLYFSNEACNVCKVIKPKLDEEFASNFPKIKIISIDNTVNPEIASYYNVFSIPTTIVFLDGNEFERVGRNISIAGLIHKISRPYGMLDDCSS